MNISAKQILMPKNERALKQKPKILVSSRVAKLKNKSVLLLLFFLYIACSGLAVKVKLPANLPSPQQFLFLLLE